MRLSHHVLPVLAGVLTAAAAVVVAAPVAAQEITLTAADGVKVHGRVSRAAPARPPIVVAFHMAGSNLAEYDPIVPQLTAAGFTVLAIDQRSGGNAFGARNKTVETLGRSTGYGDALRDLEAAHAWAVAEANGAPIIVWGSSYSAALVFLLAAKHPSTVAGILAFSPGEYLDGGDAVHAAARAVKVPVFVSQSSSAGEIEAARSILDATGTTDRTQFVSPVGGVHGSSSLRSDANPRGAAGYWVAVSAFLQKFKRS